MKQMKDIRQLKFPFKTNAVFAYPLKISENPKFLDIFSGYTGKEM